MREEIFARIRRRFPEKKAPFVHRLNVRLKAERPYEKMRVLLNLPVFINTLLPIECLLSGGAELVVTKPRFVESDPEAISLLKQAGIPFVPDHFWAEPVDIRLDCCAELADSGRPRIGAVEITQTGAVKYRARKPEYPVISVDDSSVKRLEDGLGSADGFMRAIKRLVPQSLDDKAFVIFGFGKVGSGIAQRLSRHSRDLTVIDQNGHALERASRIGYEAIPASDKKRVDGAVKRAFCVVTATGVKGFVSENLDRRLFSKQILVNVGAEDEFGEEFSREEVLFGKKPVNFSLKEPTTIQFLDPAFYAYIVSIEYLLKGAYPPGVHALPADLDEDVLRRWCDFHQYSLENVKAIYGERHGISTPA